MLLFLSACASSNAVQRGTALHATGPQAVGVLGFPHAQVGKTYRFAFPPFVNGTGTELVVESVKLTQVPEGVKVIGYPVYSVNDTTGYILDSQDGLKYPRDMTKMPNYAGKPIMVKPHKRSDFYAMTEVHVTGRVKHHLGSCQITYSQKGKKYRQTLRCDFALDMK
ncbi:hypothetical protein [Streptomyces sp. SAS_276]|uniref:hypothetical protein n=1 Tax=Streptomyces sp. SAS_276 TaxID=3412745 RepID=UPI00403D4A18